VGRTCRKQLKKKPGDLNSDKKKNTYEDKRREKEMGCRGHTIIGVKGGNNRGERVERWERG